jgi:hypothetical protein
MLEKRKRDLRDLKRLDHHRLMRIAALYVTTHSDYFMDRAIALLGRRDGVLDKVILNFVRKLDDKYWFVYRQVCLQTNWLTFRSLETRDKSSKVYLKRFMTEDIKRVRNKTIESAFETASNVDHWIKFRKTPYVQGSKLRDRIKDPIVLAFFDDWSEPDFSD